MPLPEQVYQRLKSVAKKQQKPATQLAKQALEQWLDEQEKLALHEEIARYAVSMAGTVDDLDESLCLQSDRRLEIHYRHTGFDLA
jgi:predicted transcriptional regulator